MIRSNLKGSRDGFQYTICIYAIDVITKAYILGLGVLKRGCLDESGNKRPHEIMSFEVSLRN